MIICAVLAATGFASAHTVFLLVESTGDGSVRVEAGFSDGGSGAGLPVAVLDAATGETLSTHTLTEDGVLFIVPPEVAYEIELDAGEGHRVRKDGPMPAAIEQVQGCLTLVNSHGGYSGELTSEENDALDAAQLVVGHEYLAGRLRRDWGGTHLVLVEPAIPLGGGTPEAESLRETILNRIASALKAGKSVVVLTHEAPADSPDWSWLLEDYPDAAAAGASRE